MTLDLGIDTATDLGSVALGTEEGTLAEVLIGPRRHAMTLMAAIETCLRMGDIAFDEVERLIVADGPGSFTGLRIGWATAQGLCAARDWPLYTTPSLMALAWAWAVDGERPVAAMYDALRGDVYAAIYSFGARDVTVHTAPVLTTVGELSGPMNVRPALAVGDGAESNPDAVRAWTGRDPVGPPRAMPRAGSLLRLAGFKGGLRRVDDPSTHEPDYGRLAEAQVRWERAHGRPLPDSQRDA